MSKQRSYFQCWLFVCWMPMLGIMGSALVQMSRITGKPKVYISIAKVDGGKAEIEQTMPSNDSMIIETIESAEMRRRALDRVRALNPDLKEIRVEVKVSQNMGSSVFDARAFGTEPEYTRIFLDALLDEFIAFRRQTRERQRSKALTTLAEDVFRGEKSMKDKQGRLAEFEKANNTTILNGEHERLMKDYEDSKRHHHDILDLARRYTVGQELIFEPVTIVERASDAVEDLQERILRIAIGALAGLLASLLIAAFIRAATRSANPPALPTPE